MVIIIIWKSIASTTVEYTIIYEDNPTEQLIRNFRASTKDLNLLGSCSQSLSF